MTGGEEEYVPLTEAQLRTLESVRAMVRTWPLEVQAKVEWLRYAGLRDGPSEADILRALKAMDAVEAAGEVPQ